MDFDTIRPVISGLVGATIAGYLAVRFAKQLPHAAHRAKQKKLAKDQKIVIRVANIGAGIGLVSGLMLYYSGFLDSRDWRGFGLTMGLMALLPMLVIIIGNLRGGLHQVYDGFTAYSLAQKTPSNILFPLMGLMVCGGIWAAIEFVR
ncbi:hypothetical protein HW115_18625 [Verrucomicrobiaceae bacterium N1E253]|uniref:Uncharacterized protein n=1 Tax=Oceaniferula marina TaxID=2748318 RepID=A0A851GKH1_9BACT|nr:hypothetical protein [Oceaniferula marina]NWK57639.1 hypothetical protein [Oceaniferula marina]